MWDSKRDTDIKNRLSDSVGEGKGGMIWENTIETYGEGNGNPLQYSCLETPMNGGAW